MKKIISLILTLTILVSMAAVSVGASIEESGEYYIGDTYFSYTIESRSQYSEFGEGKTLVIRSFSDNFSRKLTVPDEINGISYDRVVLVETKFLQTVILGDGIKYFGHDVERAYGGERDRYPQTVKHIEYLYVGKNFHPDSFDSMRDNESESFENLMDIFVPEDNPYMVSYSGVNGYNKVYTKDYKTLLYIPTGQLNISGTKVWKKGVTTIAPYVFTSRRDEAARIKLDKSLTVKLTSIEGEAFWESGITEFNFGKDLKKVTGHTFINSKKLKKITFYQKGKTLEYIGQMAFYGCENLKEVRMTRLTKVPTIKRSAFEGTKSGIKFYVKNRTVAKKLKAELQKKSKVKNAKILVGKKVIYKNITDK